MEGRFTVDDGMTGHGGEAPLSDAARSGSPLAILAGGGDFPLLVANAAAGQGRDVLIFGIVGEASMQIEAFPHVWLRRGQLGLLFSRMRARGIVDLVMIGWIRERRMPRFNEIDLGGLWGVLCNIRLLRHGDDSVLRFIARVIESRGFRVVGAADIAPELAIAAGVKTISKPDARDWRDIDVGLVAAKAHGATDRGQAVVARDGAIVLRETSAGTDAMLAAILRGAGDPSPSASGVLVKCLKPYQDRRLDMPAIGIGTVERAAAAGLRGIAVGAGETLVADLPAVVTALDRFGMFLVGVEQQARQPGLSVDRPVTARRIFIVAGEASGDLLGAGLMGALQEQSDNHFTFHGVGGPQMRMKGLQSLFPISDIAVMGIGPVLARLPLILRRISETAAAAISASPDAIVLIDSPDFTHRVAAKIRRALPSTPIIVYVSPTVWFWRPGRAPKLARFCDRLLALLPFEPAVHKMLAGPPTTYVGHPFVEKRGSALAMRADRGAPLDAGRRPRIVVLPGSRRSEVRRLTGPFGAALALLANRVGAFDLVLPVVEHVRADVENAIKDWSIKPMLVSGEAAKLAAFAEADVALAASGTVTLELGLARVPTVAAYRLDWIGRWVKHLLKPPKALAGLKLVRSAQLTNVIVGEMVVPEFIDGACTPVVLADALEGLLRGTPERRRQFAAFDRLAAIMQPRPEFRPNVEAARAVLEVMGSSSPTPAGSVA